MPISTFARRKDIPNPNSLNGVIRFSGVLPNDAYIAGIPKIFFTNFVQVDSSGVAVTVLHTYTVPAKTLKDNEFIEGVAGGNFTANDNDKSVRLVVAGTNVIGPGLFDLDGAVGWFFHYFITRISSTSLLVSGTIIANALGIDSPATTISTFNHGFYSEARSFLLSALPDLDSNSFVVEVKGQGTSNADVFQKMSVAKLVRF